MKLQILILLILGIFVTNNVFAVEFSPLEITHGDGNKIHQGFIGNPIIFQQTITNWEPEPVNFQLEFSTRLPDDTIVNRKTIPVNLNANETKTFTYQFNPTKEGNFITGIFTESFPSSWNLGPITYSVLDASKNYDKQTINIQSNPLDKKCTRICVNPSELTTNVGSVIEWINDSQSYQTIQSGVYREDSNGISFSADNRLVGVIPSNSKFSFLVLEPGEYKYYFSEHRFLQYAGIIHAVPSDKPPPMELLEKAKQTIEPAQMVKRSFDPPLKQFRSGILVNEIKCREPLIQIEKYNGMPVCVKPETKTKLIERGWSRVENSTTITGTDMSINYQISGGKISSILGYSKEASGIGQLTQTSLFLMLDTTNHGEVTLILPRYVIDAKVGDSDDGFFVVLDEMETEFTETKSVSHRTISFSFPAGTKNVEIIGYGFYNEKFSNYPG